MFRRVTSGKRKTGSVPVYLNVYDLTPMNGYAYWFGLGVYHSGVEGIFEGEPRHCPGFTFRKSILIGRTDLGSKEVRSFMEKLAEEYTGNTYNLITKNCNHFCNDACIRLAGKPIPRWVNRLARLGLLCNCVLPAGLNEVKVRNHTSEDRVYKGEERRKLRSHSSRFSSSSTNSNSSSSGSARSNGHRRHPPSSCLILTSRSLKL